jgi:hypothetical protein
MQRLMRQMTDGKQTGEEQKDSEQTCERGICDPLRVNRFSSFLQADGIKHEAYPNASQKWQC